MVGLGLWCGRNQAGKRMSGADDTWSCENAVTSRQGELLSSSKTPEPFSDTSLTHASIERDVVPSVVGPRRWLPLVPTLG